MSKFKSIIVLLIGISIILCGRSNSEAVPITINFKATVETVSKPEMLDNTIKPGDILKGSYTYESTTPDSNEGPTVGNYRHKDTEYGIIINSNKFTFKTDQDNVDFLVEIVNDHGSPVKRDNYLLRSYNNLPLSNCVFVEHISWQLDDSTHSALSSEELPILPPNLTDWESIFGLTIKCWASPAHHTFIRAHVTEVTVADAPPKIMTVKPSKVDANGGVEVTVGGDNLDDANLYIDNIEIEKKTNTSETIVFVSPEHSPGMSTIKVETQNGSDTYDQFSFVKNPDMKFIIEFEVTEGIDVTKSNMIKFNEMKSSIMNLYKIPVNRIFNVNNLPYFIVEDLTEEEIRVLENDPNVKAVHKNKFRARQITQSLPLIEQAQAYQWGATGEGFSIAVLDTGADYRHADLGACQNTGPDCRVKVSLDMTVKDDGELDADPDKHGTNVSSIIAKTAPKTSIISLDVFEPNGAADSDVIKALNWVIANRVEYNIVAVNMSLGSDKSHAVECENIVYDSAFKWLLRDGIQVVVAAGNDAKKSGLSIPACHPLAIAVGATTDSPTPETVYTPCTDSPLSVDTVACFSNSAPTLDILAPGTNITAGGVTLSGTSQAAPHVTGALAALKSKFPSKTSAELLFRLKQTGKVITDPANGVRARRINLASAMNDRPEAVDDSAVSIEGGGVIIDVLKNDKDEHPEKIKVDGVVIPEGQGIYARVFKNKVYFYSDPSVTGIKTFRYSMVDEYGVLSTAQVTIEIQPFSLSAPQLVTNEFSLVSKLAKKGAQPFIVYESGLFHGRKIWLHELEINGRLKGERQLISGDDPEIQPNYLDVKSDEKGFTVAWIKKSTLIGKYLVQAANGDLRLSPNPYEASFYYKSNAKHPSVTLIDSSVIIGWEKAWDPGKLYAQTMARIIPTPVPHGSLQEFPEWISFTKAYGTVTVDSDHYIHLRNTLGRNNIEARKLDREGNNIWNSIKKLPDWGSTPPPFETGLYGQINKFKVIPDNNGFALVWSHAKYAGKYGVSFQKFDSNASSISNAKIVLSELNSSGDVALIKLGNVSYRVVWNETHANFSFLVSAGISQTGKIGEKLIDYWTTDANGLAPYQLEAMPLTNENYLLSWSNNKRQLMSFTRKILK